MSSIFFFFNLCDNGKSLKIQLEEKMTKKLLFVVLFTMLFLAALTVSVSADQDGNSCWCNNDQYGCWITGEKGGRDYIMFWSESARDFIMGKGSKAPIVDRYFAGKLPLECGISRSSVVVASPADSPAVCTAEKACANVGDCPGGYVFNEDACTCKCGLI